MSFRGTGASQTFDSLNPFILKGEPAQGLGLLYDSLLAGSADEPDAAYGLIAESLEYPARPLLGDLQHAPRGDLLRRPRRSPPRTWSSPGRCCSRRARPPTRSSSRTSRASRRSTRTASSSPSSPARPSATCRRSPAASRSCRSTTTTTVDFADSTLTPPVGSGRLRRRRRRSRQVDPLLQEPRLLGRGPAGQRRLLQLRLHRLPVLRRQQRRLRGAEDRRLPVPPGVLLDPLGDRLRLPGAREGLGQARGARRRHPLRRPGLLVQPAPRRSFQDPRVREAIGLMFNFEWTNETLFYGLYQRTDSFFENSPMQAEGLPRGRGARAARGVPRPAAARDLHRAGLDARRSTARARPTAPRSAAPRGCSTRPAGRSAPTACAATPQGETLTLRLRRRQPGDRAGHQPLRRRTCAASASTPATPQIDAGADAAAPGELRLRHPARPLRRCRSAPRSSCASSSPRTAADTPGLGQPLGRRRPGGRRADREGDRRPRPARRWRSASAPSTACCAPSRSGCRTGTAASTSSPTGTCSAARRRSRPTPAATPTWWFDQAKYDKLKAEGALR